MNDQFVIGKWVFDPNAGALRASDGSFSQLEDRAARTLHLLCIRRGEVVSKQDILSKVWLGRAVSSNSVAIVISDLRRVIEDDRGEPSHIVTVARRGYRLEEALPIEAELRRRSRPMHAVAGALVLLVVTAGCFLLARTHREVVLVAATANDTGLPALDPLARSLTAVVTDAASKLSGVAAAQDVPGKLRPTSHAFVLQSRLIIWNGAPEVAMSATDMDSKQVVWSGFASGPQSQLARHTSTLVSSFAARLPR